MVLALPNIFLIVAKFVRRLKVDDLMAQHAGVRLSTASPSVARCVQCRLPEVFPSRGPFLTDGGYGWVL